MYEIEKKETLDTCRNYDCVGYKVFNSNHVHYECGHTACYAGISCDKTKDCIVVNKFQWDYLQGQCLRISTESCRKKYLNWLLNDSPFAESFITKDSEEVLKEGLAISTCNVDGRLLVGGMTALRGVWETNNGNFCMYNFERLLDAGVHPDFAFILGHCINSGDGITAGGYGGHTAIAAAYISVGEVANFLRHKYTARDPFYKDRRYAGINTMWRDYNEEGGLGKVFINWLRAECKKLAKSDSPIGEGYNPFVLEKKAGSIRGRELIDASKEIYQRFVEEFMA